MWGNPIVGQLCHELLSSGCLSFLAINTLSQYTSYCGASLYDPKHKNSTDPWPIWPTLLWLCRIISSVSWWSLGRMQGYFKASSIGALSSLPPTASSPFLNLGFNWNIEASSLFSVSFINCLFAPGEVLLSASNTFGKVAFWTCWTVSSSAFCSSSMVSFPTMSSELIRGEASSTFCLQTLLWRNFL